MAHALDAGPGQVTQEVIIDSLPYFDSADSKIDPIIYNTANALISDEKNKMLQVSSNIQIDEPDYSFFETNILKNELKRIESGIMHEGLDFSRYKLTEPSQSSVNDLNAWKETVDLAGIQMVYQMNRKINLQLLEQFGANKWKNYNSILDVLAKNYESKMMEIKKEIQTVNWKRKSLHQKTGEEIKNLEKQWADLTMQNFELQMALNELENK
ncbi:MAG: Pre-mRNA-splicing factor SPF27 [Paramarteilia canceri]